MNRSLGMLTVVGSLAAGVGLAGAAFAGPLERKLVAADATWVVHIDVEAALASTIGRLMLEDDEAKKALTELREKIGVDGMKDLKGITIWGREAGGEDAVIVAHTTAVVDDVLEKFRGEAGIEVIDAEGYEVLSWTDGNDRAYGHVRRTRRGDDRIVFMAHRKGDLTHGLRVADGEDESAASGGAIVKDKPGEGAIVFVSIPEISSVVPGHMEEFTPPFFGKLQGMRFEAGERGGRLFAEGALSTATSEDATTVFQAVQGLVALGKIVGSSNPEMADLVKLAEGLKIASEERTVTFSLACDAGAVREALSAARAREQKKVRTKADVRVEEHDDDGGVVEPAEKARKRKGN
ncbi:MAG: hypothetical protein ACKVU4_14315 [Phycisphaerales bacterium]